VGKRKLYEVVAHPITKIMCHSSRVLIFFPLYCSEKLAGSAATDYSSSQDCGKPVNTSVCVCACGVRACVRACVYIYIYIDGPHRKQKFTGDHRK
jgi:hypothetical protein